MKLEKYKFINSFFENVTVFLNDFKMNFINRLKLLSERVKKFQKNVKEGLNRLQEKVSNYLHIVAYKYDNPSFDIDPIKKDKKRYNYIFGNIYHYYKYWQEAIRLIRYNYITNGLKRHLFFIKFNSYSIFRIISACIILLCSLVIDYIFSARIIGILNHILHLNPFSGILLELRSLKAHWGLSLSNKNLLDLLKIYLSNVFVIVGIIVTVFSVGISQSKLPQLVKEYVYTNVINNIFGWYITVGLYTLFLIVIGTLIPNFPILISFFIASIYTIGLLINLWALVNDFFVKNQTTDILKSLSEKVMYGIQKVSDDKRYGQSSYNIIRKMQEETEEALSIQFVYIQFLFERDIPDSYTVDLALVVLAEELRYYATRKKFINNALGGRYPNLKKKVKDDTGILMDIKRTYDEKGLGDLYFDEKDFDWFERRIIYFLKKRYSNARKLESTVNFCEIYIKILSFLLNGNERLIGLYDLQSKFYEELLEFFKQIKKDIKGDLSFPEYLNNYFLTCLTILKSEYFKKDLEQVQTITSKWTNKTKIISNISGDNNYAILTSYMNKIKIEEKVEGMIITPQSEIVKEIKNKMLLGDHDKSILILEETFTDLDTYFQTFTESGENQKALTVLKIKLQCITYILNNFQANIEKYKKLLGNWLPKNSIITLFRVKKEDLLELVVINQIEFCLIESSKNGLYEPFNGILSILYAYYCIILGDIKDTKLIFANMRSILITGGYLYLDAEFKQNYSFLKTYTSKIEKVFNPGAMVGILKTFMDPIYANHYAEASKYLNMFREKRHQIDSLPKRQKQPSNSWSSFTLEANHPSKFIRKVSEDQFPRRENCIEGFCDFLEKRETIKNFCKIIKQHEQHTQGTNGLL